MIKIDRKNDYIVYNNSFEFLVLLKELKIWSYINFVTKINSFHIFIIYKNVRGVYFYGL